MTAMVRMTVEFEDAYYEQTATSIARLGVDIVDEETYESEEDD